MTFADILKTRGLIDDGISFIGQQATRRPGLALSMFMAGGLALMTAGGLAGTAITRHQLGTEAAHIERTRADAQRELNALAARVGELQAQANRLNALGDRLTRMGELPDGEFNFEQPVPTGGAGPVEAMHRSELDSSLQSLEGSLKASGEQLSVIETLLADRRVDSSSVPSGLPILGSYVTSDFGYRADPIVGGSQFHKGIDFEADVGDPVLAVADGVISYSGSRSGYGNTIEIDHGNGYVTRYAHNSSLVRRVGELVRTGQEIALAGSTGRSTGPHVHFEVWKNGRVTDPRQYLKQAGRVRG